MSSFIDAFQRLLGNEGKYSDNPADPGGATMWGITQRVARANGYTGPMPALPLAVAQQIAKAEYWDKYQCGALPYALGFMMFDAAYNGGHVVEWLQQAVGAVADGDLGPKTIAAANAADPYKAASRFAAYRVQYLTGLSTWINFGRGWANRIANDLLYVMEN